MKSLSILLCFVFSFSTLPGQVIPENFRIYKAKIRLTDEPTSVKGVLLDLKDTVILIGNAYTKRSYREGDFGIVDVPVRSIKRIKIRRMGKQGKSLGIGFGAGALFGGIMGYASGDWDSEPAGHPDSQAYFGAVLFGLMGAGVGFFAGIPSKYFRIYGDHEIYHAYLDDLNKYAIVKD